MAEGSNDGAASPPRESQVHHRLGADFAARSLGYRTRRFALRFLHDAPQDSRPIRYIRRSSSAAFAFSQYHY